MMFDGGECSPAASADEPFIGSYMNTTSNKKKKSKNNKRRFTDEQIRSLESMFKNETRLEPRKKLQLAKELGLQPRQVAIWFQNKRARWKSKQLERDYSILRASYESLASRYESLKKEKQALVIQLQKLNEMMQRPAGDQEGKCCGKVESDNIEEDINNTKVCESEVLKRRLSFETSSEHGLGVLSDEDSSIKAEFFGLDEEEPNLISMVEVEPTDESLTTSRELNLDSDGLFDQSSSGCQWWDFWA